MAERARCPASQEAIRASCVHPTGTFVEFGKDEIEQSIVARFERQARAHPGRLAVKTPREQLSYAELNSAANRVAHAILARRGSGPEAVALLFAKGTALVVAVLGALKAGKTYVLLDPTLPAARLSYLLEDSQAALVVTGRDLIAVAGPLASGRPVLDIDELDGTPSAENPGVVVAPDAFAFILYTSGSTGQPKGVVESHRTVLHYIMTETNALRLCAADRLTFLASQGRDLYRALLNGAAVFPVDVKQHGFVGLARWLAQEEITIYNSVASAFRHFVATLAGHERFPHLRLIKLMGESVYWSDVELYRKHFAPPCVFVNWYGPNETGLLSHYLVDHDTPATGGTVPVGYAVEGKTLCILGEDGEVASAGEIGEVTVSSRYLSPGYWRRPDLTAAAFLPVPGGDARVYRTGDLGSMAADGCLTHLGREDQQIKIRGYRVEIAEIETALLGLAAVREAVVVAREDGPDHRRLVAYLVPAGSPAPTVSSLRAALAAQLPDYMIPSAFVALDRLPLIGIGKVDRRALPAPGRRRPDLAAPYVAARTPVEVELCRLWAELLDVELVGIHDHFLDLGGHSLLATQIVSRAADRFRVAVPPQALLAAPTVAEMALVIVQHQVEGLDPTEVASWLTESPRPPSRPPD